MYEIIVRFLNPYTLLYLLMALAVGNLWRRRREGRGRLLLVTVPFVSLTLLWVPALVHLALGTLEWQYHALQQRPDDAEAIVVLAAGLLHAEETQARAELDADTWYRCLYAAQLYHQGKPCRVLVSGGKSDPDSADPACAVLMHDFLLERGVNAADLIVETDSRTTYENALNSARLLERHGIHKVALVVDAVDMFRALRCFRYQGIETIPSPCHYRTDHFEGSFFDFLPNPNTAANGQRVWHEWLGVAWYRLKGRI